MMIILFPISIFGALVLGVVILSVVLRFGTRLLREMPFPL
jgi:hypothetical protein